MSKDLPSPAPSPSPTPFEILGLTHHTDRTSLEAHVRTLQLAHHPDRFVNDASRQQMAQDFFAQVVWAYQQINTLEGWAEWVLKIAHTRQLAEDPGLLAEMFEWGEEMAENTKSLAELDHQVTAHRHALETALQQEQWDAAAHALMWVRGLGRIRAQVLTLSGGV